MGQPNFMEKGSCCGKWGLSQGQESCPKSPVCELCFNTSWGQGYRAYFNQAEFEFARAVGSFWTNLASSGDPSSRGRAWQGGDHKDLGRSLLFGAAAESSSASAWSSADKGGGAVLRADLPGGSRMERELYGDPRVCRLWDAYAADRAEK